jgi:hypothetical protein
VVVVGSVAPTYDRYHLASIDRSRTIENSLLFFAVAVIFLSMIQIRLSLKGYCILEKYTYVLLDRWNNTLFCGINTWSQHFVVAAVELGFGMENPADSVALWYKPTSKFSTSHQERLQKASSKIINTWYRGHRHFAPLHFFFVSTPSNSPIFARHQSILKPSKQSQISAFIYNTTLPTKQNILQHNPAY